MGRWETRSGAIRVVSCRYYCELPARGPLLTTASRTLVPYPVEEGSCHIITSHAVNRARSHRQVLSASPSLSSACLILARRKGGAQNAKLLLPSGATATATTTTSTTTITASTFTFYRCFSRRFREQSECGQT